MKKQIVTSLSLSLLLFSLSSFCMDTRTGSITILNPNHTNDVIFGWTLLTKNTRFAEEIIAIQEKTRLINNKGYKESPYYNGKNYLIPATKITEPFCSIDTYITDDTDTLKFYFPGYCFVSPKHPQLALTVRKYCPKNNSLKTLVCVLNPEGIEKAHRLLDCLEHPDIMPSSVKDFFSGLRGPGPVSNLFSDHAAESFPSFREKEES